ncbi:MAG: secondary thiamine-phosphate synthase enzyme YjbQ [Desulfohalobiaceae bacterium]|nr:secondary thiamine-phosphate synthase enzyme YjbQ [Desulfohalobiaceae bacterium]
MQEIQISTHKRQELVNITEQTRDLVRKNSWQEGTLLLFCTHTTAGLTINEAADPSVARDLLVNLSRLIPEKGDYRHLEGNSDAHIKSSLIGCSEQILVHSGRLLLGTWQGVFFAEFDGPRSRKILAQWTGSRG